MKITSEITNKEYKTVEECLADEKAFLEAAELKKRAKEEKKAQRASRAKEVEEAYKNYVKLLNKFCQDYGSFHMTLRNEDVAYTPAEIVLKSMMNW